MDVEIPPQLLQIAKAAAQGEEHTATVRDLLQWFGAKRRGSYIVEQVRDALKELGLFTAPDFEYEFIDSTVRFVSREQGVSRPVATGETETSGDAPQATVTTAGGSPTPVAALARQDPSYRVRKLAAANRPPLSITPDKSLADAVTTMLLHHYAQLPVMQNERKVLGLVSWKSIGQRLAMGVSVRTVSEAMDPVTVVSSEASIFQVADLISKHEVVLVQASTTDPKITGIITSIDLSQQFVELGEPFLLLGQIENHLRKLLDGKYDQKELADVRHPMDTGRCVQHVSDLTFGEYVRLLEKPERWEKTFKSIDRARFIEHLNKVKSIRNDVMHFNPDGIEPEEIQQLRQFATFLEQVSALAVSGCPAC